MAAVAARASFVGRSPELRRLDGAFARARNGHGTTILCRGEAGIGKTRLVSEFRSRIEDDGGTVLMGACLEVGSAGLPYGPFAEALRGAVHTRTLDPAAMRSGTRDQLAMLLPDLGRVRSTLRDDGLNGVAQVRLFEATLAAIEAVRAARPTALIIEDIHWADRSTQDLLGFLVQNARPAGVLIVATIRTDAVSRDDPVASAIAELGRRADVERLDLRAWDLAETSAHLASVLGTDPDHATAERIHRRADGNPFFVEQLAWAYLDGDPSMVPESLRDILINQLSQQPVDVQELLAAVACAGPMVDAHLLAQVLDRPSAGLLDSLRQAVRAHLLVRAETGDGERYAFRHALLAEATEADLLEDDRRRLHGRCADALVTREPRDGALLAQWAVRVAHHRERAGDLEATIDASIRAAIETSGVAAHRDAMEQYRRAIQLLPGSERRRFGPDWDTSELFAKAADCAAIIGETRESAVLSRRSVEALPDDADPWRRGALLLELGEHLWIAGDTGYIAVTKAAADVTPAEPPTEVRADALNAFGLCLLYEGDAAGAEQAYRQGLIAARACDAHRAAAMALAEISLLEFDSGRVRAAESRVLEALSELRKAPPSSALGVVYVNLAAVMSFGAQDEFAVETCREGLDMARRLGSVSHYGGAMAANGAESLLYLGRLAEASEMTRMIQPGATLTYADVALHTVRAQIATAIGDMPTARSELAATEGWDRRADPAVGRYLAVVEAEAALADERSQAAISVVDAGLDLVRTAVPTDEHEPALRWLAIRASADVADRARAHRDRAAVAEAIGVGARHLDALFRLVPITEPEASPRGRRSRAYAALAEAEVARSKGENRPELWRKAITAWQGNVGVHRWWYARLREAESTLATGRDGRTAGTAALRALHADVEAAGARGMSRTIEGIARRARVILDVPAPATEATEPRADTSGPDAGGFGLTRRETEILGLVAEGLTNREIGERLFISPKTAGVHVSNILGKLEVGSRVQAAAIAHHLEVSDTA